MKIHCCRALFGILALTSLAAAQAGSNKLAVVNGETITEEQVTAAAAGELAKLEANRPQPQAAYARKKLEIMWKSLDSLLEDKLISAEAAKLNTSKDELLDIEIYSNVDPPTNGEVEAFYQTNKSQIPLPHDQAIPQVRQYMIDQSAKGYRDALMRRLKKTYGATTYLDPLRTEIAVDGFPTRGAANAPVTIVEFSDFECPYCGNFFPTLKAVEKNYPDKVRIVYRQFPLTNIHPHAQKAAEASLCADDQKHFWEFHDSMFGNQQQLTVDALKQRAVEMKLDVEAFNACLDSGKKVEAIKADVGAGRQAGVTGTPTIFINGRIFAGSQAYGDIRETIEDELKRTTSR